MIAHNKLREKYKLLKLYYDHPIGYSTAYYMYVYYLVR